MEHPPTILVVDDETDICHMLKQALAPEGYRIIEAVDGPAAIAAADEHPIDLVILDIFMPGMNGLQVLESLKSSDPNLKVVILSAITQYDANFKDVVLGKSVEAFLDKPVKIDELLLVVKRVLAL